MKLLISVLVIAIVILIIAFSYFKKEVSYSHSPISSPSPYSCKSPNKELADNYYKQDTDNDGVKDLCDNCPTIYNPYQENNDGDGVGNVCDKYKDINHYSAGKDSDNDGKPDSEDEKVNVWDATTQYN